MAYSDSGLPGMLFSLLDSEEDSLMMKHAQETITSILMEMAADNLSSWLSLCKEILTVSVDAEETAEPADNDHDENEDDDDDDIEFTKGHDSSAHVTVQPRWTTSQY